MSPATPVPPDSTLENRLEEMALVRGGWLWRQSSILRRWKRNWFALWLDGTLGYYHDETAQDEEDRVFIHANVRDIKVGQECHDVQPPEGRSRDGLLTVSLREGGRLHLCAETRDDAIAWKTALMEANATPVRVYSPYQDYYEVVPPNAHEATYIRSYYGPPYAGKSPCACISQGQAPPFPWQDPPNTSLPEAQHGPGTSLPPGSRAHLTSPGARQCPSLGWWRPLVANVGMAASFPLRGLAAGPVLSQV
ncbi:pleckstrin homology domain-containing family B member 1 isoform X3 [Lepus europaeus]|uniref:pleckstrin homology domain-containing family B member 1 isoform X3 n=1 Tax=Lepus europaeus TaxID=9983 RepID=UPI002B478B03|nr:pleckstrin homology domain-containing family B member 1 isoform X3 [Lepus europaeus]